MSNTYADKNTRRGKQRSEQASPNHQASDLLDSENLSQVLKTNPSLLTTHHILQLQRTIGNQNVIKLMGGSKTSSVIQRDLVPEGNYFRYSRDTEYIRYEQVAKNTTGGFILLRRIHDVKLFKYFPADDRMEPAEEKYDLFNNPATPKPPKQAPVQGGTLIVGCGNACHYHNPNTYTIDELPKSQADLTMPFENVTNNEIPDGTFNAVYFERFPNFELARKPQLIQNAYRVLASGGYLHIVSAPSEADFKTIKKHITDAKFNIVNELNKDAEGMRFSATK